MADKKTFSFPMPDTNGKWFTEEFVNDKFFRVLEFDTEDEIKKFIFVESNCKIKNLCLNEKQKELILERWNCDPKNPPSMKEMIVLCFKDEKIDTRSAEARAIKTFLATRQLKVEAETNKKTLGLLELTNEQKDLIGNLIDKNTPLEVARIVYNKNSLVIGDQETRTIIAYIKTLPDSVKRYNSDKENILDDYIPPKSLTRTITRVNCYIDHQFHEDKLKSEEKRGLMALLGYLNTYRFISKINCYESTVDRELFESSFIRWTYDKPDLTQEEVDQYISLSTEIVMEKGIEKRIEQFQRRLDEDLENEDKKLSVPLVDAISGLRKEYGECAKRQKDLTSNLQGKRSERLKNEIKENASILNLVKMWKDEESRVKLIRLNQLREKANKTEMERLLTMDEIKCQIFGQDPNNI